MDISVIIPAHNEEKNIARAIAAVSSFFDMERSSFEIIVVDSFSHDRTARISERLSGSQKNVKLLRATTRGKGAAVRAGILEAKGDLILFSDADLSTPIEEFRKLRAAIDSGADIAIASRRKKGATILRHQSRLREMLGSMLNRIIQAVYVLGISDTQCGFKLFKAAAAKELFREQRIDGFLFDLEVLYLAKKKDYRIKEVPVTWSHGGESKVRVLRELPQTIFDLFRIKIIH